MMRKYTYEVSFLVTVLSDTEDNSLQALDRKFPEHDGRIAFHNIDKNEVYCTLFEVRGIGEEE